MTETLLTLSQSALQDFQDCPRRFDLRYLQQLAFPAIESEPALENEKHRREGEFFHRLAQQSLLGIPPQQVGRLAITDNLQRWWSRFLDAPEVQELAGADHLYTEAMLSTPLGDFRLVAKYDLIAICGDKVRIFDWKTYRHRPKNENLAARWQTRVYQALLVQAGAHLNHGKPILPGQIEMTYWFAEFPDQPAHFRYTPLQFERDCSDLSILARQIQQQGSDAFHKTADEKKCSLCCFRSYCGRGTHAGVEQEMLLERESETSFDINYEQIGEIEF